jgi:hypothetical protein
MNINAWANYLALFLELFGGCYCVGNMMEYCRAAIENDGSVTSAGGGTTAEDQYTMEHAVLIVLGAIVIAWVLGYTLDFLQANNTDFATVRVVGWLLITSLCVGVPRVERKGSLTTALVIAYVLASFLCVGPAFLLFPIAVVFATVAVVLSALLIQAILSVWQRGRRVTEVRR